MEITRRNFADEIDNITNNLKRSCFISFDAEFTALLTGDSFKYSLFDTNETRYNQLKTEVSNMIMSQVGLTMFVYDRDHDTYIATGYTFHLCPQAFGDVDQSFIFQASTLQFLCRHGFNFNKFTYEGIPYLSKLEEEAIQQQRKDNTLLSNLTRKLDMDDERILQKKCSEVSKWLTNSKEETMYLDVESPLMRYIVHNEVRIRFPAVLTTDSLGNSHKILIYRNDSIEGAKNTPMAILEEKLLNHLLGFSQIIRLLERHQKPLVGHNILMDMVLLHNQFIGTLPKKYVNFKKNMNKVFCNVYDTKYLSREMARRLTYDEVWKSNGLQDLYEFFAENKCRRLNNGTNLIRISTPFNAKQTYHEAGWDSYCSGYCFIRLGHWAACEKSGKFKPVSPTEILSAVNQYCNKVNIIRGAVPFMNLVGDDPPSHRPSFLHVLSMKESVINISKIAVALADFGSIDIKPYGRRTALIAPNTSNTHDRILKQYRKSPEYRISKYNVYRHSTAARVTMWGSVLVTGSIVLYFIHKKVKL